MSMDGISPRQPGFTCFWHPKTDIIQEIYQYIVETPANYLKYYWGYLNFLDLREMQKKELGEDFDLRLFHQKVLEIGPVPFPVLYKYMTQ